MKKTNGHAEAHSVLQGTKKERKKEKITFNVVLGIPYDSTEEDLNKFFSGCGEIVSQEWSETLKVRKKERKKERLIDKKKKGNRACYR